MDIISRLLHDMVKEHFPQEVTKENFEEYKAEWFNCAYILKDRFLKEGLIRTALELDTLISFSEDYNAVYLLRSDYLNDKKELVKLRKTR